jgi:hypothetical protein
MVPVAMGAWKGAITPIVEEDTAAYQTEGRVGILPAK